MCCGLILCLFLTVDPRVLSLKVLYICYCHGHASGIEKPPERERERDPPLTQTRAETRYRSRIHADVESNPNLPSMRLPNGFEHAGVSLAARVLHHHEISRALAAVWSV